MTTGLFGAALPPTVDFSTTCGKWQAGVVMPVRAGLCPERMAARVGEHSGLGVCIGSV